MEAPSSVFGDAAAPIAPVCLRREEALYDEGIFRELCFLSGFPILVSIVYTISVRVAGVSAKGALIALAAMTLISVAAAVKNVTLVRSALRLPAARDVAATLLVALLAAPCLLAAFWLIETLGFPISSGYLEPYVADGWPRWAGIVDVAVVTPIGEELLFRGVIQPKLGQIMKPTEALIVQAALFSALHLSPVSLATHFAMGLAFGWLRLRSGSLVPGIVLHGAWNASVVWSSL